MALKVLVVTNMYPTDEEPWFGSFVRDQAEDLAALGIELRVLHFDGRRDALNYLRAARNVRRLVSREHFDLVHAHYGLTGAVVAVQHRVPTVTTFHGSDHSGEIRWQKWISWIVSRRSAPVFVSKRGGRMLGRPSAPVIPAGVDTELFKPVDRRAARRELGWSENQRYALLPGSRSVRTKRADLFDAVIAEARKEVPDLEGVALEGFSREEASLVLNAVDVTLMTSDHEGSPVTVRESLACMTPVVSVDVGDVPRVIADLPGCGIFPRDVNALARGVVDALAAERHPDMRRRAQLYSRRVTAERLAALYRSVASSSPTTSVHPPAKVKSPRRLLMIVHGPFPPDPRVARAVGVAVAAGWETEVLATRQPGQLERELVDGAHVTRLPIEHRWGGGTLDVVREYLGFAALAWLRAARLTGRHRFAVVHVHNPPDFLIVGALIPKLLGARVIFDVHDISPDMFAMRFAGRTGARLADRVLRLVERAATAFADEVLTVHEPYRHELISRGVPAEKITVVMNTVDERLLPSPRDRPAPDGFRVVYQGTITPHYGVELLVEAVAQIAPDTPDVRLEIYGDGDAVPLVRSLARKLGVADRVWLSEGFLTQVDVLRSVQFASVGVIPNLPTRLNRFALSTKLFEYVALGLPVVCADLPTIRAHFDDGEVLFFEAGGADSLAAALREVRRDPAAAAARSEAARLRYEAYRWAGNARRYLELLDRCARPRRADVAGALKG